MRADGRRAFSFVSRTVRKYQKKMVLSVGTRNTPVLLAEMEEVPKLTGLP
jgi:hypothetical protein